MTPRKYDSTVARMAGNIAAGMVDRRLLIEASQAGRDREKQRIVDVSVSLATKIVDRLRADRVANDAAVLASESGACRSSRRKRLTGRRRVV